MYAGTTSTKFGQVAIAEPLRFDLLEFHDDTPLKEVEHDIPIPVLDQEDLHKQGIDVTKLVPGAADADALGSCTCNTGTAHIAERWAAAGKDITGLKLTGGTGAITMSATDGTADEEFAILLYHLVTDQTGVPSQEWPPTDCGSNGLYVCQELIAQGFAVSDKSASNVTADIALLQNGSVDLANTVIKVRNSWSTQFALNGDYLLHASTLNYLLRYYDFKAVVLA